VLPLGPLVSSTSPLELRTPARQRPSATAVTKCLRSSSASGSTKAARSGLGDLPSVPILTSDVYEWAPGGFFVVHSAFGKIGETAVGGVEIIGVDGEAYRSTFYDSFGNVHSSRLEIEGDALRWTGDRTRCTVTMTDDGRTQVAHHEASADGVNWAPSRDVTLRKVA
jgi:hypothetical protein